MEVIAKEQIISRIQEGNERVLQTFGSLSDQQLATQVHEGGWTAKEVLAHLAGRAPGYDMLIHMAEAGARPDLSNLNIDERNQQLVDERIDNSRAALLDEFRDVHEDLVKRVNGLSDDLLQRPIPHPRGGEVPLAEMLLNGGGQHSINHTAEVEEALGLSRPNS